MNKLFIFSLIFLMSSSLTAMEQSGTTCPFLKDPVVNKALLFRDVTNDAMSECLHRTLQAGISPNIVDENNNCTPLYLAAGALAATNVQLLLDFGAEPNDNPSRLNTGGQFTPLHIVCSYHQDSLEEKKCDKRLTIVKALLDKKADPSLIDCHKRTPLFELVSKYKGIHEVIPDAMNAFLGERKKLITLLLQAGVNTEQKDQNGNTVFEHARNGIPELGEFIQANLLAQQIKKNGAK